MRTFSRTVRCGNTAEIWKDRTSPSRAIAAGLEPVISRPLYKIWPRVGERKCVSRLKQVVLPAPLGPISAWMRPRLTLRLTSLTATKPLNSFLRPRVSRMMSSDIGRRGLFSLPLRLALGDECIDALGGVLEHHVAGHPLRGERIGAGQTFLHLFVEELLAHAHHGRAVGENLPGELV